MKKNKVILFILILFIIIGLHNCCSAFETDTEYVVDFSSIGGDLKVSFSSDNFPSSQELNGKTISDFNGVLIGYYNNYYVLYLIRTGSNVYLDSSDGSTLYFTQNLNGSDINYIKRYSFSTNKTTAYLTTADFADNYGSMWIDTNYSFNCSQSIYSNNTFTTIYENNNYINNSSDIFDNGSNGDNGGNNDNSSLISASAIESIGTTLITNITAIAPTILSVLSITIIVGVLLKFIRDNTKKG